MKKIVSILLACIFCCCLFGCSKKTSYCLVKVRVGYESVFNDYDLEQFETSYPGEIKKIGKDLSIKNNKVTFSGLDTAKINGEMELFEIWANHISVSFKSDEFYKLYKMAEIYGDDFEIETHAALKNEQPTVFIFVYNKI